MFDVGFSELVLLFVIGLLILGPERLPKVASQIGRWVGRARRTANQLRHQLEREMALNEIGHPPKWKPPPKKPSEPADVESPAAEASQGGSGTDSEAPPEPSGQTTRADEASAEPGTAGAADAESSTDKQ